MKHICHGLDELSRTAKVFVEELTKRKSDTEATIVGLSGDLGAGKTTFTKAVAHELGIEQVVTSPTFVIQKKYALAENAPYKYMIHIDAYRLEGGHDLSVLGWGELIKDPTILIFIEWPEQVSGVLPKGMRTITFTHIDESTRQIEW